MMPTGVDEILNSAGAFLAAIAAVITALVSGMKTRAEVKSVYRRLAKETESDHGTTLRDAVDRIEAAQHDQGKQMSGMARDIGRLADADQRIEKTAHDEHERLNRRIDRMEGVQ